MPIDDFGNWYEETRDPNELSPFEQALGHMWEGPSIPNADQTPQAAIDVYEGGGLEWPYPQQNTPGEDPNPVAPTPPGTTTPSGASSGSTGFSGGGGGSFGGWPSFTAPQVPTFAPLVAPPPFAFEAYAPAQPFSYDDFAYGEFTPPTLDQAKNEPGYEFARTEGLRAFQNARLPTLRTGGTMKDMIGWGNRFAEQNYGNVYNRTADTYDRNRGNAFGTWQANRGNAFDNWGANERVRAEGYDRNRGNAADAYKTNWGISTDVYDRNTWTALDVFDRQFRNAAAEFDPKMVAAQAQFGDLYNRDRDRLDALTRIATAGAGA